MCSHSFVLFPVNLALKKKLVLRVALSRMIRKWSCRGNTRRGGRIKIAWEAGARVGLQSSDREGERSRPLPSYCAIHVRGEGKVEEEGTLKG